jgi:hypothetical protein
VRAQVNRRRIEGYSRALEENGIERDERLVWCWTERESTSFSARSHGCAAVRALRAEAGVLLEPIERGTELQRILGPT